MNHDSANEKYVVLFDCAREWIVIFESADIGEVVRYFEKNVPRNSLKHRVLRTVSEWAGAGYFMNQHHEHQTRTLSSVVEPAAHNGMVAGSIPAGSTPPTLEVRAQDDSPLTPEMTAQENEARGLLVEFFAGDTKKAISWLLTHNPMLGGCVPLWMILAGRGDKLLSFIKTSLFENEAP